MSPNPRPSCGHADDVVALTRAMLAAIAELEGATPLDRAGLARDLKAVIVARYGEVLGNALCVVSSRQSTAD